MSASLSPPFSLTLLPSPYSEKVKVQMLSMSYDLWSPAQDVDTLS